MSTNTERPTTKNRRTVRSTQVLTGLAALAASVVGLAGVAGAATGTLSISAGTLTQTLPASLAWSAALTGTAQSSVDGTSADQKVTVNDNRGSGAGWNVNLSATTFTNGTNILANAGTFSVNGDPVTAPTTTTAPAAACVTVGSCTLPTDGVTTYPVALTTAATAPTSTKIYSATANTGLGNVQLSSIGYWLAVPATAFAGSYISTLTFAVATGP